MMCLVLAVQVWGAARSVERNGLRYQMAGGDGEPYEAYVVGPDEDEGQSYAGLTSIVIPDTIMCGDTVYTVVGGQGDTFRGCSNLTSVQLPATLKFIGSSMFRDCSSLESIVIPDSVTSIREDAFNGCTSLTSITLPASVTEISENAFEGCTDLTKVTINSNSLNEYNIFGSQVREFVLGGAVENICSSAFVGCTSLTSVTISDSVKSIGHNAFCECQNLTSINIPDSLESIGMYAFKDCSNLKSVTIPGGVTSIEYEAFSGCTGLISLTISEGVKSIGNSAFSRCTSLTSVTIPNSVTSIGDFAFAWCSGLTSVTIPQTVTSIGEQAFYYCTGLTSVTVPESVNEIGWGAFYCVKNVAYSGDANNSPWGALTINGTIDGGFIYSDAEKTNLTAYYGSDSVVTIPNTVKSIGNYAFQNCTGLKSVTIPEGVTSIGYETFSHCSRLTSITIPESVTSIDNGAFADCSSLTKVTINSNAIMSNTYTIFGAQVTEYVLGEAVTSIGEYAFYNCANLASITIPSSVTSIGYAAFCNCTGLTSVIIPKSVTTIASWAFGGCTSLTSATIPAGASIGEYAFYNCNITIPSTPYTGTPIALPGIIEFENFDNGGNGVGYYDTSEGNELGEMDYRADTDVDVCYTDFGYGICYSITGEWMNYTVKVDEGGIMNWSFKAASGDSVGAISIYKDDVNITGVITVPNTGDWSNYTILTGQTKVALPAGTYTLKLYFDNQGCNIDNIIFGNATVNATTNSYENHGVVSGIGAYNNGDTATLTATAAEGYVFKKWSDGNTDNPRKVVVDGNMAFKAEFVTEQVANVIGGYEQPNAWYIVSALAQNSFVTDDNMASITITEYGEHWNAQFCNILTGLSGQEVGNTFQFDFDVNWKSLYDGEKAKIHMVSGKTDGGLHEDYQWDKEGNTELVNTEGNYDGIQYASCEVSNGEWSHMTWGGTIGEKGASYIGIQMNLGMPEADGDNRGTFNFKNMIVRINGNIVQHYYCQGDILVNATAENGTVSGSGFYKKGDVVELIAKPNAGYAFKQWNDGNTDNPRTITVNGEMSFVAEFEKTVINYTSADFPFNTWWPSTCTVDSVEMGNGYAAKINISEEKAAGDRWDAQFCNIFHDCEGQAEGKSFRFSFDVKFEGAADEAQLGLTTGKRTYSLDPDIHEDYAWNEGNTEILNIEGGRIVYNEYQITKGQWQTITLEGTIGNAGANYIGIELDLAGNKEFTGNVGDFYFKNMVMVIDGNVVASDFEVIESGQVRINLTANNKNAGTLSGDGLYNVGDTVTITATPNTGYTFKQWSDGNTDNPRTFVVTKSLLLTAQFKGETGPFAGTPIVLPGVIEFENFDNGDNGEAYYDTSVGNECGVYRPDVDVDICGIDNYTINYSATGEWLNYTVTVAEEGVMYWSLKASSCYDNTGISIYKGDTNITGIIYSRNTGDWGKHEIVAGQTKVALPAGTYTLKAYYEAEGCNIDNIIFGNAIVNATAQNGSVSGIGAYNNGDTVKIEATPNAGYIFKQWNDGNTDNPRQVVVDGNMAFTAEFEQDANAISHFEDKLNTWYINGDKFGSAFVTEDNMASITVSENGNLWDSQFCNILTELNGQKAGNKFQLDFDIYWDGPIGIEKSQIMFSTGKYGYGDRDYVGSREENTELVNANGNFDGIQYVAYPIVNNDWTHISWGGTIGEKGAESIGVGIYFNKFEEETDKRGTFNFKNMIVRINDTIVRHDYCRGDIYIDAIAENGTVTGGGFYNNGDKVELVVTPNTGYAFKQWSDGNTDNPRTITVNGEMSFVAEFEKTVINYTSADFPFNTWYADGCTIDSVKTGAGYIAKIYISEEKVQGNRWDAQFVNIYHEFDGQAEGKSVKFSFDVKFDGESDIAQLALLTGKITWKLDPEIHEDYQWGDGNTEIIDVDGNKIVCNTYQIDKGQWQTISIEGTIGEAGSRYIGLEIDLAGDEGFTGNVGDFYFKNMTMVVDGKVVTCDYAVPEAIITLAANQLYGTVEGDGTYYVGDTATIKAAANTGYKFIAWSNGDTASVSKFAVIESLDLTAIFSAINYSITYNLDGGNAINVESYTVESEGFTLNNPEKEGYNFTGWTGTDLIDPATEVTIAQGSTGDRVYTANWGVKQFTISFDCGEGTPVEAITANFGDTIIVPANPTKEGFEFSGWNPAIPITMPAENIECVAMWTELGDTKYAIEHYLQNVDGVDYTLDSTDNSRTGKTGSTTNVAPNNYVGFSLDHIENATITDGGNAVAKIYYKRNIYTLAYDAKGGELSGDYTSGQVLYGAAITAPAKPTKTGYTFTSWSDTLPETMPAENLTFTASWSINRHNIVYVVGGDTIQMVDSVEYGAPIVAIAALSMTGYTFSGWQNVPATMPDSTVTISGAFTVNQYTIAFNTDGGSSVEAITADYGAAVAAPANPTKENYTFTGWDKTIPETMPAENLTITATWSINRHNIVYVVGGDTIQVVESVAVGTAIAAIDAPVKTGYTFGGWQNVPATMPDSDVTISGLFTVNQYTITFNTDGGSSVEAITADYGTEVTAPANPTKENYTFIGWDKTIPETMPAENLTITATWAINKHNIVYVVGGDTIQVVESVAVGTAIAAIDAPAKTGYTFSNWQNVPATMPDSTVTISGTFAVNQYTITFNTDGGSAVNAITADYGAEVTAPANPTKDGCTFSRWDKDIPATMPAENLTITALWTVNTHSIVYVVDGTTYQTVENVAVGTAIQAIAAPVKTGYAFSGWQTVPATMPDANVTINGTFTINQYTVKFVDGNVTIDSITANYGTAIKAPADPTKAGYIFSGWSVAVPDSIPAENLTIAAVWEAVVVKTYAVKVAANDTVFGKVSGAGTYNAGDTAKLVATANEGYEFVSWSDSTVNNPYKFVVTGDTALVANFEKKAVEVKTFAVKVAANDTVFGSVSGAGTYNAGDTAILVATANEGYEFISWSDSTTNNPYKFVVDKDVALTANFEKKAVEVKTFAVKAVANDTTFGSVLGAGVYNNGDTVTISALGNDDYEFVSWSDGNTDAVRTIIVTSDVNLTATFSKRFVPVQNISGLKFYLTDTAAHTAELIGYTDSLAVLNAPAEIEVDNVVYKVNGIGKGAFAGCSQIDSIVIPESVETIGSEAFANCTGALSIAIPSTVDSIGFNAFLNVRNIVYYGSAAGSPWGAMTLNGTIEENFILADSSLTVYTGTDTIVVLPDSISSIGQNAFAGNETVTSVTIPESVTEIGDGAFNGCTNLGSVEIPEGVTSIGTETFANCTSLDSVDIPNSVTEIGSSAFNGCTSLTVIQIPVSVTVIGASAFANCSKLDTVDIPESVNEIGNGAFTNCTSLVSISIPVSVTVIGAQTFAGCSSLNSIDIPTSTTEIGNGAFDGCSSLTTIDIPVSVTTIGNGAFAYCSSLVTVQIGEFVNVNNIKNNAVSTLADESVSIGSRAFSDCYSLKVMYLPLSVSTIGDSAFAGCKDLTIYCEADSMPDGWSESWNPEGCTVVWGYKGETPVEKFNLIASVNNKSFGSVTGSATYNRGETATITATAAEGYKFVRWSDGNTDNPRTIIVADNIEVTAIFEAVNTNPVSVVDDEVAVVNIFAYDNTIVVENATSDIYVYDANGRLITIQQSVGQRTEVQITITGVYLVKVANITKRVMVF